MYRLRAVIASGILPIVTTSAHVPVALGRTTQGFRCVNAEVNASSYSTLGTPDSSSQIRELGAGTYGEREPLKMLRIALVLASSTALPLRAPRALARGSILSTCNKGCPEEGGSRLGLTGFSEAMAIMFNDGSSSKSDESASTFARAGENGLDRAASKVFATSVAATMARLQLYQNHASAEVALAAPDATKSGVDEEEAAHGRASWWPFQFLAILLELLLGLFVFGRIIPRRSSLAKGAAWRSYVAAYLLISPEIALVAAAATSVRGSDYTITKSSKSRPMSLRARQSRALGSGACSRATSWTTATLERPSLRGWRMRVLPRRRTATFRPGTHRG